MKDANMAEAITLDADDELLVAYLDGELPREQRDGLENRLIADESLRLRMQSLQRSWDMLDWLPHPPASEHAVQTTMQLVVADLSGAAGSPSQEKTAEQATLQATFGLETQAVSSTSAKRLRSKKATRPAWPIWLAWFLAPPLIGSVVFASIRWTQIHEIRSQIADFPVAIDMDAYTIAENTQLLDDLMNSTRLKGVVNGSATPDVERIVSPHSPESLYAFAADRVDLPDHDELTSRLDELPQSQRIAALSRWDRFNRLDESAKSKLRSTATRIRQDEKSTAMLEALRQYVRFRELITNETAAKIENGSGAARTAAMDEGIDEVISSIGRSTGRNLSNETIERIDFTIVQIVKKRLDRAAGTNDPDESAQRLFRFIEQRARRGDDPDNPYRAFALFTILRDPKWTQEEGRSFRDGPPMEQVAPLNHQEFETLQAMLTPQDVKTLNQYVSDPWVQSLILRDWAVEAVRRKIRGRSKSPSLSEQYENMSSGEREILDLSSPEKARKELSEGN